LTACCSANYLGWRMNRWCAQLLHAHQLYLRRWCVCSLGSHTCYWSNVFVWPLSDNRTQQIIQLKDTLFLSNYWIVLHYSYNNFRRSFIYLFRQSALHFSSYVTSNRFHASSVLLTSRIFFEAACCV
jgi:hypothetical protein